jgi:hypothetical protein
MPSTIRIVVTADGRESAGQTITVPDLPLSQGSGSRLRAERLAALGMAAIHHALAADEGRRLARRSLRGRARP